MVIDATRFATRAASRRVAPAESASTAPAVALSPAPVGSIGPSTRTAGTSVGTGSLTQIPRAPCVTNTGRPVRRLSSPIARNKSDPDSDPRTSDSDSNSDSVSVRSASAAFTFTITLRKSPARRRLSAQNSFGGPFSPSRARCARTASVTIPQSASSTWSSAITASTPGRIRVKCASSCSWAAAGVGRRFFVS